MTFFIDKNLSPYLSKGMKAFGEDVVHLEEIFPSNTADTDWLEHMGKKGWFLITRDEAIRRNPAERAAIQRYKVGAFFLGGKDLSACEIIQQLVRNWPQIKEYARKTQCPFAFRVRPKGTQFDRIF